MKNWKTWIKAAGVRAVKTMAQVFAATLGTGAIGVLDVAWTSVLSITLMSGIASIATSLAGLPEITESEE